MAIYDSTATFDVSRDRAFEHAQLNIRLAAAGRAPDLAGWRGLELDPKPLAVNDLNGSPLFYDFSVMNGKNAVGYVRAGASKLTAAPVMAVGIGARRWDPLRALREAKALSKKRFRGGDVQVELVCYSYPKVGVLAQAKGKSDTVIYDAASLEPVTRYGSDSLEGSTAWSYLNEVGQRRADSRARRWDLADAELEAVRKVAPRIFNRGLTESEFTRIAARLVDRLTVVSRVAIALYSSRVLKFGPRCSPHDCFELYAQQTDVFCAVATGQMILDFYKYHFTQDQIATAMNTDAGGTTNPNQVTGYETLSNNGLDATFDGSADWAEARAEIDANRPCKSGIFGHARACAGWMRQNLFLIGQPARRWLRIYDPWPWNADICAGGEIVWEDWTSVDHTNFIYVRHT
jgi:Peptidase_C39 like family